MSGPDPDLNPTDNRKPALALVVTSERDPFSRTLESVLNDANCGTEFFSDSRSLLTRASECNPSLIIADGLLSHVDGFTLCRLLKGSPPTDSIPVLLISQLAARQQAEEAGADAFLRKPCQTQELVKVLRVLLSKWEI